MATYAVTYTWVIRADSPEDVPEATEEYVHSVEYAFSDPVSIEEIQP